MSEVSTPSLPTCPIIGVTGSIASGKSTFTAALEKLGATVIDADVLAREVVTPGSDALKQITDHFGAAVLADGALNRAALAAIIFADEAQRRWLENLLHPLIRARFAERLSELAHDSSPPALIVYSAPLLLEAGVPPCLSRTVLITAPREVLLARAVARGGITTQEAQARLARQMPDAEKRKLANVVIENIGTLEELQNAAAKLFQQLTAKAISA